MLDFQKTAKIFLILAFFLLSTGVYGQSESRRILAFYDSQRGQSPKKNHIHANAEMVLNHLGCIVEYRDIASGLPDDQFMRKYRGVLTWFYGNSMSHPKVYLQWAAKQIDSGLKFVILGNIGAFRDAKTGELLSIELINDFSERMGFRVDDRNGTTNPALIDLVYKDADMAEFERTLEYELSNYEVYQADRPGNRVYLKLKRNDIAKGESDLVFTTPAGGFAATGYVLHEDESTYKKQWRLNPFSFFNEAFALQDLPRPDVTTLNGLRIWTSHIDGDALISRSEVKPNSYCGEIIRDEILKAYHWPVSVSVVVGEVETDKKFVDIARSIFAIDWIEAASHSYSHPFYWSSDYENKGKYPAQHLPIQGYQFNLEKEIFGSVKYINRYLLPANKKVRQFFWTGNCEPTPKAIELCNELHIKNINGGDTVFDQTHPSYTNVAPLSVRVGGRLQLYSANANENIYTNEWKGPFYGYRTALHTFKNTESPRRIKPIDVYYHFYSGEKWAALNALKAVLEATTSQDVAPMFISDYIDIVEGFFATEIGSEENGWRIKNYGRCTTMRFDNMQLFPDLNKSENLLGYTHYQGSLYVYLHKGDEARIVFSKSKPTQPFLAMGSHRIADWTASREEVAFTTDGFGDGVFRIANLNKTTAYELILNNQDSSIARTDETGSLSIKTSMSGPIHITVKLAREL